MLAVFFAAVVVQLTVPIGSAMGQSVPQLAGPAANDPSAAYNQTLAIAVTSISPRVVTVGTGELTISGTVTNTSGQPVSDLRFRDQRGSALTSVAAVRKELATPSTPDQTVTPFLPFTANLAPKQSSKFSATVPTFTGSGSLAITAPGVYPLMLNINATIGSGSGALEARVGELHTVLTVLSVPGAGSTSAPTSLATTAAVPFAYLWPIQDRAHLGVNGVFLDDALVASISKGGRLDSVLGNLEKFDLTSGGSAATVILDPELLDELQRMAAGYRVLADPGVAQAALVPGAATSGTTTSGATSGLASAPSTAAGSEAAPAQSATVPGTGEDEAATFLARLRIDLAKHQTVLLPYGDPDTVGLARAGATNTLTALIAKGRQIAAEALPGLPVLPALPAVGGAAGSPGILTTVAYPASGRGDSVTIAGLAAAGDTAALLSGSVVEDDRHAGSALIALGNGASLPAAVANSPFVDDAGAVVHRTTAAAALQTSSLAALLAVSARSDHNAPLLVVPDRFWGNAGGAQVLASLAGVLTDAHVVRPTALAGVTASAGGSPVALDDEAVNASSPPGQVQQALGNQAWVNRLTAQFSKPDTAAGEVSADPKTLLDPLSEALTRAYSYPDPGSPATVGSVSGKIMTTVSATVQGLRDEVSLINSNTAFALSASSSTLPLGVQNNSPYNVIVRLRIEGDRLGLNATQPADVTLAPGQARQIKVDTRVNKSGTFDVQVELQTLDNVAWNAPSRITIKSNAYGVVILIVIWVAGGVLVVMVVFQLIQRFRKTRTDGAVSAGSETPAANGPPEPGSILDAAAGDEVAADADRLSRENGAEINTDSSRPAGGESGLEPAGTGPETNDTMPTDANNPNLMNSAGQLTSEVLPGAGGVIEPSRTGEPRPLPAGGASDGGPHRTGESGEN